MMTSWRFLHCFVFLMSSGSSQQALHMRMHHQSTCTFTHVTMVTPHCCKADNTAAVVVPALQQQFDQPQPHVRKPYH